MGEFPTDDEIVASLKPSEDSFVERKSSSDSEGWLKTIVAFANSCPVGRSGLLLIGVRDDGSVQDSCNLEKLQKTLNKIIEKAYPPIQPSSRVLLHHGQQFLAVIVPGSPDRPHFAGPAYVRRQSESVRATEAEYRAMIAQRSSKVRAIAEWMNRRVTVEIRNTERIGLMGSVSGYWEGIIRNYSKDWVQIETVSSSDRQTVPLSRIKISNDDSKDRLKLELYPVPVD